MVQTDAIESPDPFRGRYRTPEAIRMSQLELLGDCGPGPHPVRISRSRWSPAPVRHSVSGVKDKIHDDLFQLRCVRFDPPQLGVKIDPLADVVAEHRWQHFHQLSD